MQNFRALKGIYTGERGEVPGHATFRRPYADQTRIALLDSRSVDQPDITPDFRALSGWPVIRPQRPAHQNLGERIGDLA